MCSLGVPLTRAGELISVADATNNNSDKGSSEPQADNPRRNLSALLRCQGREQIAALCPGGAVERGLPGGRWSKCPTHLWAWVGCSHGLAEHRLLCGAFCPTSVHVSHALQLFTTTMMLAYQALAGWPLGRWSHVAVINHIIRHSHHNHHTVTDVFSHVIQQPEAKQTQQQNDQNQNDHPK